jgi:hypothetical protein
MKTDGAIVTIKAPGMEDIVVEFPGEDALERVKEILDILKDTEDE